MRKTTALVALLVTATLFALVPPTVHATRLEDLCDVGGARPNQLIGYGLVVGLASTGDRGQARFTVQSTAAMLRRLGATIDPGAIQTRNAAAVMVTATLPPYATSGAHLDVTVASMGNARSLAGGVLLQTPLYGADRRVYAVAQGPLLLGGFGAGGASGSSVQSNHLTTGRVPEGALVERDAPSPHLATDGVVLHLREPSFVNAQRVAAAIDASLGEGTATPVDGGTVRVGVPEQFADHPVALLAQLALIDVEADSPARVVLDERTGTVAIGANVRIGEVAIAQGGLTVEITETPSVSQPNAFAGGQTAVVNQTQVAAQAAPGNVRRIAPTASLQEVVDALNALGAKPRDLVPIFQALRSSGALRAELEVQ